MSNLVEKAKQVLSKHIKKDAFTPMDQIMAAQQQQGAPMAGGAPMDPAAMAAMAGGGAPAPMPQAAMAGAPAAGGMVVPADQLGIDPQMYPVLQQMGVMDAQGNVDINMLQQIMASQGAAAGLGQEAVVPPPAEASGEAAAPGTEAGGDVSALLEMVDTADITQLPPSIQLLYKLMVRAIREVTGKSGNGEGKSERKSVSERLSDVENALAQLGVMPQKEGGKGFSSEGAGTGVEESEDMTDFASLLGGAGAPAMLTGQANSAIADAIKKKMGSLQKVYHKDTLKPVVSEFLKR